MKHAASAHQLKQRARWERMHVAIRCGLHPAQPALIRVYLGVGRWLAQQGQLEEPTAHERMLALLLDTARDDALPWFWRSVCLEHTPTVVARLTTLMKHHPPAALQDMFDRVQSTQAQMAVSSSGTASSPADS
jgi:hypothetical protein